MCRVITLPARELVEFPCPHLRDEAVALPEHRGGCSERSPVRAERRVLLVPLSSQPNGYLTGNAFPVPRSHRGPFSEVLSTALSHHLCWDS